jgi:hypothetical protein
MVVSKILELCLYRKGRQKQLMLRAWLVPDSHVVEAQIKEEGILTY